LPAIVQCFIARTTTKLTDGGEAGTAGDGGGDVCVE
jgi:hypothetical protein